MSNRKWEIIVTCFKEYCTKQSVASVAGCCVCDTFQVTHFSNIVEKCYLKQDFLILSARIEKDDSVWTLTLLWPHILFSLHYTDVQRAVEGPEMKPSSWPDLTSSQWLFSQKHLKTIASKKKKDIHFQRAVQRCVLLQFPVGIATIFLPKSYYSPLSLDRS